jgi:hypothetical protein
MTDLIKGRMTIVSITSKTPKEGGRPDVTLTLSGRLSPTSVTALVEAQETPLVDVTLKPVQAKMTIGSGEAEAKPQSGEGKGPS